MNNNIKALFHIHTQASSDASITPHELVTYCLKNNISTITITDHNTMKGIEPVRKIATQLKIIPGEEIQTKEGGELIGLFLTKEITKETPALEVIKEIRRQGGIVYLPHPFDTVRRRQFNPDFIDSIASHVDIVEIFNSRNIHESANIAAKKFAILKNIAGCVGADAHIKSELKNAHVLLPSFSNSEELMTSIKGAVFNHKRSTIIPHFSSAFLKLKHRLTPKH